MRKLMIFTIGYGAACAAMIWLPGRNAVWIAAVIFAAVSAAAFAFAGKRRITRYVAVLSAGFLAGCLAFGWFENSAVRPLDDLDGKRESVCIIAAGSPVELDYGFSLDGICESGGREYRVTAYLDGDPGVLPGDTVSGIFSLRAVEEGNYHRGVGIFLLAYQEGSVTVSHADAVPLRFLPALFRARVMEMLQEICPADVLPFAKALLLGDQTGIDYETDTAFKVSGVRHIIAVSGLHVTILFTILYILSFRRRWITLIVGTGTALLYAAMVGFTPSVTRACIMHILLILAQVADREYDPLTALAAAVQILLLRNPYVLLSVGFQLSVASVAGIVVLAPKIVSFCLKDGRFSRKRIGKLPAAAAQTVIASAAVTVSASITTTPLLAVYFGCVSLIGVVTNLLVIWAVTAVFYGLLLACVFTLLSLTAGKWIAGGVAVLIRYIIEAAKAMASLPLSAVYTKSTYIVIWLVLCYVLLAVFVLTEKKRVGVLVSCAVLGLCLAVGASWAEPLLCGCRVTVLDVGQGQSVLLQSGGKSYLVDCGGSDAATAADTAAETLLSMGISRLDGLILTHFDADHVCAAENLSTRIGIGALFAPDTEDKTGTLAAITRHAPDAAVYTLREDMILESKGHQLTIFGPVPGKTGNDSSLCILFQTENCDILITGDRTASGEAELIRRVQIPELELLVVGHHGAASSTSEALLAMTRPAVAAISVGKGNRYGHPAEETVDRLTKFGCVIYRTDRDGSIVFRE